MIRRSKQCAHAHTHTHTHTDTDHSRFREIIANQRCQLHTYITYTIEFSSN